MELNKLFITVIIILIISAIFITTSLLINTALEDEYVSDYINESTINYIKLALNAIIAGIGIFMFYIINKHKNNNNRSLATLDEALCPTDRPKKITAAGEYNGGLDSLNKTEVEKIKNLYESMQSTNNNNFINSIVALNDSSSKKIELENGIVKSQDDPNDFITMIKSVSITPTIFNFESSKTDPKVDIHGHKLEYYNIEIEQNLMQYANDPYLLVENPLGVLKEKSEFLKLIETLNSGFELIGFIVHKGIIEIADSGGFDTGGHYVTYVLREIDGRNVVYECDDIAPEIKELNTNNLKEIMGRLENRGNAIKTLLYKSKYKNIKNTKPSRLYHKGNSCYIASALQLLMSTDLLDGNNSNISITNDEDLLKSKKKELNNIRNEVYDILKKIKTEKSQTREGMEHYNKMRAFVNKYIEENTGTHLVNNLSDINNIIQKGLDIIKINNEFHNIKINKNHADYIINITRLMHEIDNTMKQTPSIQERLEKLTGIKSTTQPTKQKSFVEKAVDAMSSVFNGIAGNVSEITPTTKPAELDPEAPIFVPTTKPAELGPEAPIFVSTTKPAELDPEVPIFVPETKPAESTINQEDIKINNDAFVCLVKELTKDANTMISRTKQEDKGYLLDSNLFLQQIKMTNNKNKLYYDNKNLLREGIYFSCILNSAEKNISTTQRIAEFLANNGDDIVKEIISNIERNLKNKYKELLKKGDNKQLIDQLKLWILKVNNAHENIKNNKQEILENTYETNEDNIEDDEYLNNLDKKLQGKTDNIFMNSIVEGECGQIREMLKLDDETNEKYIPDLKDFLIARIYSIVNLLKDVKSKRIVKRIRNTIVLLIKKLEKYVDINDKEQIKEIDMYINSIIQLIENEVDYEEYDGEDDIVEQYNSYTPNKKTKNKRYGTDSTPFDEYYSKIISDAV